MPKLKCKVENCAYNYDWLCRKNAIDVDGISSRCKEQTCCASFCKDGNVDYDAEFATFERTPTIHTEIYCDAVNCVYEKNQKCYADRVEILKDKEKKEHQTHCQTFEPIENMK